MTKVALFAGGNLEHFSLDFDVLVGVDRGSLLSREFVLTWLSEILTL